MRSQFLALLLVVLFVSPSAAQNPAPDRLQRILDGGALRVGTTMDTPAFSMRTSSGQLEGFDIDALATLAPALGVRVDFVKMTFGSMLGDLAADKFDIAMSGMGRTFDRARTATFSKPYMRYGKLMAVRAADQDRFGSFSALDKPGIKIAYNKGGLNETFAKSMFKQATPVGFDSNALATAALLDGSVDAQVADSTAALYMARQDARIAVMDPANVFNPVYVAILLHREDQTLLNYLNIWIDQIEMDGTLATIRQKWLGDVR
jgi:cyclohexadienyl dehydratase